MTRSGIITTRIGDTVKVEISDGERSTLPNYATVAPHTDDDGTHLFTFHLYSGKSGNKLTEREAINAAARAIRSHHKRHHTTIDPAEADPTGPEPADLDPKRVEHTSTHGNYRVLSASRHRNGVGGTPFYVGIVVFTTGDFAGSRFHLVTVPPTITGGEHEGETDWATFWTDIYVTNLDLCADEETVAFAYNSWRGDRFASEAATIVTLAEANMFTTD